MKARNTLFVLSCLLIISCVNDDEDPIPEKGTGFEIYLTEEPYMNNLLFDYSHVNFDTILLADEPMLYYSDLLMYDTVQHKLTLDISHDSLKIGVANVYGRMFVVTIDSEPVYCGFKWPVISSVPCSWVYIAEPYYELDSLNDKEIVISFSGQQQNDPRLDDRIVSRLKKDKKIQ